VPTQPSQLRAIRQREDPALPGFTVSWVLAPVVDNSPAIIQVILTSLHEY
jgi:hypothetical protein